MTPGQLATVAPTMVTLKPMTRPSADGGREWAIQSLQVPEAGQVAMTRVAAMAHAAELPPKVAASVAAKLYRTMLAEALLACGIDSPAVHRAAGTATK
jgi:hypothetical protein